MSKTREGKNRFIREVKSAAHGNPNVDMDLVREWQEITKTVDSVHQGPAPEPKIVKQPRLQPIPLRVFNR